MFSCFLHVFAENSLEKREKYYWFLHAQIRIVGYFHYLCLHAPMTGRSMLIFPNVTTREFLSGYISLYQASRISRPLDIALTICQCGPRFSVSILFFFKEPTFLERAPGGSHPSGGPHLAGRASFKKTKTRPNDSYKFVGLLVRISVY